MVYSVRGVNPFRGNVVTGSTSTCKREKALRTVSDTLYRLETEIAVLSAVHLASSRAINTAKKELLNDKTSQFIYIHLYAYILKEIIYWLILRASSQLILLRFIKDTESKVHTPYDANVNKYASRPLCEQQLGLC